MQITAQENLVTKAALPKTFRVSITRPFGKLQLEGLSMYVHGQSWQAVLAWVEKTFPGVDIRPTVARKTAAPVFPPRVGNTDPVIVQDVDAYGLTSWKQGRRVTVAAPEGHWRKSIDEVADSMGQVASALRKASCSYTESFLSMRLHYQTGQAQDWTYTRLEEMLAAVKRADQWHENVWKEYLAIRVQNRLELPERRPAVKLEDLDCLHELG